MHNIPCSEDYFDINVIILVFFWLPYHFLSFYFQHTYEDYFDINVIILVFFWLPYHFLSFYFQHT